MTWEWLVLGGAFAGFVYGLLKHGRTIHNARLEEHRRKAFREERTRGYRG